MSISWRKYATPLFIEVRANPRLRFAYLLFVSLALLSLLWLPLPIISIGIIALGLMVVARRTWRGRAELGGAPAALIWDAEQRWWWEQGGQREELALCGESFVSPSVAVLRFRPYTGRRAHAVVLTPDTVGRQSFRRMVVRFRLDHGALESS